MLRSEPGLQWLLELKPRVKAVSLDAWARSKKPRSWVVSHPNLAFAPIGVFSVIYLLWINQAAAAATLAGAWFALARHFSQTEADRRRRITESYSKAVSQLASDKIEERLGGIYTLESISKESPDDYWTVMETLTAFVRERSQRNERERTSVGLEERVAKRAYFLWLEADRPDGKHEEHWAEALKREKLGEPPATDINAVLTVIKRRDERNREREKAEDWHLDLSGAVLRRAILIAAHLEGADLREAHLEGANLTGMHLEKADLKGAHLQGAELYDAHLQGAQLWNTHFQGARLWWAHLQGAELYDAHLQGAEFVCTHLQKVVLLGAHLHGAVFPFGALGGHGSPINRSQWRGFWAARRRCPSPGGCWPNRGRFCQSLRRLRNPSSPWDRPAGPLAGRGGLVCRRKLEMSLCVCKVETTPPSRGQIFCETACQ